MIKILAPFEPLDCTTETAVTSHIIDFSNLPDDIVILDEDGEDFVLERKENYKTVISKKLLHQFFNEGLLQKLN